MSESSLGDRFVAWAQREPAITGVVVIGSRVRQGERAGAADEHSDWDYQVITREPARFEARAWIAEAGLGTPVAYVLRGGRLGSALRFTALFAEGELDVVLIPHGRLRLARRILPSRSLLRLFGGERALGDLAVVLRDGYRLAKGEAEWGTFLRRVVSDIPSSRLSDREVCDVAEGFVCDYVSTRRKIDRAELLAAQRWLHQQLAEANFRLLHELRQRAKLPTFPDARRLELLAEERAVGLVRIEAHPDRESLLAAVEKSAETCRTLVRDLVGEAWQWPDLSALRLRGK